MLMKRLIIPFILLLIFTTLVIAAQETEDAPALALSVAGEECHLQLIEIDPESTPEATPEPDDEESEDTTPDWLPELPTYTIGDDCQELLPLLTVAANGTLWMALLLPDSDDWLPLETLEDDPYPPQLDGRGRYFGCSIPMEGEQVCYVLTELDEETVLVAVPLWVGDAYYAPQPVATDEPEVQETAGGQTEDNSPSQNTGDDDPPQPTQVPPTEEQTPPPQPTDHPE
jgi:hypothetical protein